MPAIVLMASRFIWIVFAVSYAYVILGEVLTLIEIVGGLLIMTGVGFTIISQNGAK